MTTAVIGIDQVSRFLFRESRLLDESRYGEWLDLWAPEAEYWVPCNDADNDPLKHIALLYLDRQGIEGRVIRLQSGQAHAQDPMSRMNRLIGNVEADHFDGTLVVRANFNLTELRRHEQHTFAGRLEYTINTSGDDWLIERKKVSLVNMDEPIANLTFMI